MAEPGSEEVSPSICLSTVPCGISTSSCPDLASGVPLNTSPFCPAQLLQPLWAHLNPAALQPALWSTLRPQTGSLPLTAQASPASPQALNAFCFPCSFSSLLDPKPAQVQPWHPVTLQPRLKILQARSENQDPTGPEWEAGHIGVLA